MHESYRPHCGDTGRPAPANQSGEVLRPRATVTIKGVGELYSGVYYVSRVTHTFSGSGSSALICRSPIQTPFWLFRSAMT